MSARPGAACVPSVTAAGHSSKWIFRLRACEAGTLRLFCIPPAGKGATIFNGWARALHPAVEVNAVRLPGRENRMDETPISDLQELIRVLGEELLHHLPSPYAVFGHCTGAQLAFELCRHLRSRGAPLPSRLLVANRLAPQLATGQQPTHLLPLDQLISHLRRMGTDPGLLDNRDLMEFMEPTIRADFALYDKYEYTDHAPLPIPISVFGDRGNADINIMGLRAWQHQTAGAFAIRITDFETAGGVPLPPCDAILKSLSQE